jgi:hypothetical protein
MKVKVKTEHLRDVVRDTCGPVVTIFYPKGSKILGTASQGDSIYLRALVPVNYSETYPRTFLVVFRDEEISKYEDLVYVGSERIGYGATYHVFELITNSVFELRS